MSFQLKVNGRSVTVDAPADMPLLWVLRDILHIRGTKYGCGIGECGACTVLLGGKAVRSCVTAISDVGAQAVTTIEGLSPDGNHPLQRAWQELDVSQCGYCQAGQILSAAELLSAKPRPTDEEIDDALDGNLCRCGTYLRIRSAVRRAAEIARTSPSRARETQE